MFKEYIESRLRGFKTKKEKIKYLNKVMDDSWCGMSFKFQSNAMGMREEAKEQLEKLKQKDNS